MADPRPSVAVIIPAYHSDKTIARSLEAVACQDYASLQIFVVESEPLGFTEELIRSKYPHVHYIASPDRLLPHAARNLALQQCDAPLIACTDPDIYTEPGWVTKLVAMHERCQGVIAGSLENATNRWLDWGMHFTKFDMFLPMGAARRQETCATGNMLCARADLDRAGGFAANEMLADLLISWKFAQQGVPITFDPELIVWHHHTASLKSFLGERFARGRDFARLRQQHEHWGRSQVVRQQLLTLSGLRLAKLVLRTGLHARQARHVGWFLLTLPVITLGHAAWLIGEMAGYRA